MPARMAQDTTHKHLTSRKRNRKPFRIPACIWSCTCRNTKGLSIGVGDVEELARNGQVQKSTAFGSTPATELRRLSFVVFQEAA